MNHLNRNNISWLKSVEALPVPHTENNNYKLVIIFSNVLPVHHSQWSHPLAFH